MAELRPYPGMPRWVKMAGIVVLLLVVLGLALMLTGGHDPGGHWPAGAATGATQPAGPQQ